MVWVILVDGQIKSPAYTTWQAANERAIALGKRIGDPTLVIIQGLTVIGRVYPTDLGDEAP